MVVRLPLLKDLPLIVGTARLKYLHAILLRDLRANLTHKLANLALTFIDVHLRERNFIKFLLVFVMGFNILL